MKDRRDLLPRGTLMFWQLCGILMGYSKEDIDAFVTWASLPKSVTKDQGSARYYYNKIGRRKEMEDFLIKAGIKGIGYIPSPHTLDLVKNGMTPKQVIEGIQKRRIISDPFPGRKRMRTFVDPKTGKTHTFMGWKPTVEMVITKNNIIKAVEVYKKYYGADEAYIKMKVRLKLDKTQSSGKAIASLRK